MTAETPGLLGARRLRELFDLHGVRPRKELGQNFVIDPNTIRKTIAVAGLEGHERVLEIGAGAGSLTLGLAGVCREVIAVEFDRRLIPVLEATTGGLANVRVLQTDAMRIDWAGTQADAVVANLPYNIATPLVVTMLERAPQLKKFAVMTQKEVGERLAARPSTKAYGHVSVLVAYFGRASIAARVSRNAFYPVPAVDSVIVRIDRRSELPSVPYDLLARVTKAGFAQRRKTLRNTLVPVAGSAEEVASALAGAKVDPSSRAEEIGLEGWLAIAGSLS